MFFLQIFTWLTPSLLFFFLLKCHLIGNVYLDYTIKGTWLYIYTCAHRHQLLIVPLPCFSLPSENISQSHSFSCQGFSSLPGM